MFSLCAVFAKFHPCKMILCNAKTIQWLPLTTLELEEVTSVGPLLSGHPWYFEKWPFNRGTI